MNPVFLFLYCLLIGFKTILYPLSYSGRENIPDGPAIVCANHSSNTDPILISYAFGLRHMLHFMAKIELFRIPLIRSVLSGIGTFGVDRSKNDMVAVRTAMKYLKSGEKIMIFPEGTRVREEDSIAGKTGSVRLAMRLRVPIVPVYIEKNKKLFRKTVINIGKPYYIDAEKSVGDSEELSAELMKKIYELEVAR